MFESQVLSNKNDGRNSEVAPKMSSTEAVAQPEISAHLGDENAARNSNLCHWNMTDFTSKQTIFQNFPSPFTYEPLLLFC